MSLAWLAYVPFPGFAFIPAFAAPFGRFERYHAWQGGVLTAILYTGLILIGLLGKAGNSSGFLQFIGILAALWLLVCLVGAGFGAAGALAGKFGRVRPVWDLLTALGR